MLGCVVDGNALEWLAGLCDAEACLYVGMHATRPNNVIALFQVGLVREDVVRHAHSLLAEIVGGPIPGIHVRPATRTQRQFFSLTVAAKEQVLMIVETLCSLLQGKRAEALASRAILRRATAVRRYAATDLDRELCDLSHRIKQGEVLLKEKVASLVGESLAALPPTKAWLAGLFDGDGCVSVARENRSGTYYHYLRTNISSSDRPAMESVRNVVARAYSVGEVRVQAAEKGGSRTSYGFEVAADDTARFLSDLRPYLRVKAAEADVVLDVCCGKMTREEAYPILRALKQADDPTSLREKIAAGGEIPTEPERVNRVKQYRRPTYDEMKRRGLWSSEEARAHLGGIKHAVWVKLIDGLTPDDTIGNKKYYTPRRLRDHIIARTADRIVRTDVRKRVTESMKSWNMAK